MPDTAITHLPIPRLNPAALSIADAQETALARYKRLLQEAMSAADEARAEVGEVTAYHLQLIAEEATSPLAALLNDVCDRLEEDFELGCQRAAAYRDQVRSDFQGSR